jgi:hypothetical protein
MGARESLPRLKPEESCFWRNQVKLGWETSHMYDVWEIDGAGIKRTRNSGETKEGKGVNYW